MNNLKRPTNRRKFLASLALTSPLAFSVVAKAAETTASGKPPASPRGTDLKDLLTPVLEENSLPAVAAAVLKRGVLVAAGAIGLRKIGAADRVTIADKFHLGSDTKAMTATLAAMLVEQGRMQWNQTLAEIFPDRAAKMHPSYRKVTLEMLLTHQSGAAHDGTDYGAPHAPVKEQRLVYLDSVINKAPKAEPGTGFSYSNAGYIIAGAMMERITGQAWEDFIQQKLFRPLGMTSAGFGPPSKPDQTDQPWGHVWKDGKFQPRYGDNHRALGPAGTVHCALADYLKFAGLHASNGLRPPGMLAPAFFAKLHEPAKGSYAMGWIVAQRGWAQGRALTHSGSNTMNFFVVWLAPKIDLCLAIAANAAGDNVPKALDKVAGELVKKFAG
jgi:CubicO group peptidase (beta-lactamase class C family)